MLKIRLQGTNNDITWLKKIMERNSKIKINEFSDLFPNKGTKNWTKNLDTDDQLVLRTANEAQKMEKCLSASCRKYS